MSTHNLMRQPAYRLAQLVRDHEVSATDLVNTAYQQIDRLNPDLNAVITTRHQQALGEAAQLKDTGQPFLGVPILLKGLGQSLAGEPSTNANRLFQDYRATITSNYTRRLQAAGFIIIGQTNFPEFGFKNVTDSQMYGDAKNPFNTAYSPGGSSGGAASALASGMVPIASASDGGGSIRIPASWSGLIGLKPTRGRMPMGPSDWRSWQGASINFALTRSVTDTALFLESMQALQAAAVFQVPLIKAGLVQRLNQPDRQLKIGYLTQSPVGTPVDSEAQQAVLAAVDFLRQAGWTVEEINWPTNGDALIRSYYTMNAGETAHMFQKIEAAIGRSVTRDDMELLTWALYQTGKQISAVDYIDALSTWDQAAAQWAQLHESYPLVLCPTTATAAISLNEQLVSDENLALMKRIDELAPQAQRELIYDQWLPSLTHSPFTQQANLTGEPAISLPTHLTKAGLPIGIQLTAAKGQEELLLQIAKLFEDHHQFKMLVN